MLFLADESCDFAVVRALRDAGHDVASVAELIPAATDEAVLHVARSDRRILLTEDKDFGLLAYAGGHETAGIFSSVFRPTPASQLGPNIVSAVAEIGERLNRAFVVVEPGRARISKTE